MAKTKEQKRKEAQQRAIANTGKRTEDLLWWVRQHHADLALGEWNRHTVSTLRSKIAGFYNHLRECGLPHEAGAFYVYQYKTLQVLIAQDSTGTYKRGYRKCLYCLQPLYEHHKAPCEHGPANRVDQFDALYIDERK